jgi:hypothetical protein
MTRGGIAAIVLFGSTCVGAAAPQGDGSAQAGPTTPSKAAKAGGAATPRVAGLATSAPAASAASGAKPYAAGVKPAANLPRPSPVRAPLGLCDGD